jgi:hypothetical protein
LYIFEEQMWKQQAKRTWLREGDKNTKYFHAVASAQKKATKAYGGNYCQKLKRVLQKIEAFYMGFTTHKKLSDRQPNKEARWLF